MGGVEERRTPGNTLVVQSDKPFTGLTKFGTAFLSKFECAQCNNELLNEVPPPFPKTYVTKLAG